MGQASSAGKHVLISGGSGAIGSRLIHALRDRGHQVSILSRRPSQSPQVRTFIWDPLRGQIDKHCLEGIDIVINLAGAGIADSRWTAARKAELIDSRVRPIELIYRLAAEKPNKLRGIISAAAVGFYGNRDDELLHEDSGPGSGFLPECCLAWESAAEKSGVPGLRVVRFRTGVVLDPRHGALAMLARSIRFYAGAALGSGRQWVPWIHWADAVNMYIFALENEKVQGAYNQVAPTPVTNLDLMRGLGRQLGKPLWPFPVPAFLIKAVMGGMSEVVLASTRVSADKIIEAGFRFDYPDLNSALRQLYGANR